MNMLSWAVIAIIVFFVVAHNWDKIMAMFKGRGTIKKQNGKKDEFVSELTKQDIKRAREERLQYLVNEKEKRKQQIDSMTRTLREEIKEIDIQLAMMEQEVPKKKVF